jgi:hypothetical protein
MVGRGKEDCVYLATWEKGNQKRGKHALKDLEGRSHAYG